MTRKKNTDVIIINPANQKRIYQGLGKDLTAIEPPVWVGLVSGYLKKKGFSVSILDACAENWSAEETAEKVDEMNPYLTIVVVYGQHPSASTQVMPSARSVSEEIKRINPSHKILFLGGHVSSLPEQTLKEEPADYVACGEGLVTAKALVEQLKEKGTNFRHIPDLCFYDKEMVVRNSPAPLIENLDTELSGIPWELFPMKKYRAHNWHCFGGKNRSTYASLYTTLGCPFKCSFCCIHAPFKSGERASGYKKSVNSYRFWSPDIIIGEIDRLVNEYGIENIKFADEIFVLNRDHVLGICDRIIDRGYRLNIWAYARIDTITEEMLGKMRKAGISWLGVGIETANADVRNGVEKNFKKVDIFSVVRRIQSEGIHVGGNYIFGLPEDTHATMQETLDLSLQLNTEYANFYCAMAYPGSKLYEAAKHEKKRLPDSWNGYSQYSPDTFPLDTNHIPLEEVLKFRDQAFRTYFLNKNYLHMMEKNFGKKALEEIRFMLSHELVRNNYPSHFKEQKRDQ